MWGFCFFIIDFRELGDRLHQMVLRSSPGCTQDTPSTVLASNLSTVLQGKYLSGSSGSVVWAAFGTTLEDEDYYYFFLSTLVFASANLPLHWTYK